MLFRVWQDGGWVYTWFTPLELWALSDLPLEEFHRLAALTSEASAAEAAGQSIPPPMVRPVALWVKQRMLMMAAHLGEELQPRVPRMHPFSPKMMRTDTLQLMLLCATATPMVLVFPSGAIIGDSLRNSETDRDKQMRPRVNAWLRLLGCDDDAEMVVESTQQPRWVLFMAVLEGQPAPDIVVTTPQELQQATTKFVWATEEALQGRLELSKAQTAITKLQSQVGPVSTTRAQQLTAGLDTRMGKAPPKVVAPHHIAHNDAKEPLGALAQDAQAMQRLGEALRQFAADPA